MSASVKATSVEDAEPYDLVTMLRVCSGCIAVYRALPLSPVQRIEQLIRLREEALVEMHRLAAMTLDDEAVDIGLHSPNGERFAPLKDRTS